MVAGDSHWPGLTGASRALPPDVVDTLAVALPKLEWAPRMGASGARVGWVGKWKGFERHPCPAAGSPGSDMD